MIFGMPVICLAIGSTAWQLRKSDRGIRGWARCSVQRSCWSTLLGGALETPRCTGCSKSMIRSAHDT